MIAKAAGLNLLVSRGRLAAGSSSSLPPQLLSEIANYMDVRRLSENATLPGSVVVPLSEWRRGKRALTEPLGVAKGTGWFKDQWDLDLRARSDASRPFVPHPLSFSELDKFGYARLSDEIVKFGGPNAVGVLADIGWFEPEIVLEKEPESSRPRREETFALNLRGELKLGGGLEERLAEAESLDLGALKAAIESGKGMARERPLAAQGAGGGGGGGESGPEYKKVKSVGVKRQSMEEAPGERFALTGVQRLFLVVALTSFSIAQGRTSADLLEHHYWGSSGLDAGMVEVATLVSIVSASAAVFSGLGSAYFAQASGRNTVVWFFMGLLGGPVTISLVRERN